MGRPKGPAAVLQTAPAFSFGSRSSSPSYADKVPGPGTYQPRLTSSNFISSRGTGFGTSCRLSAYGNKNPGPSEYDPRERIVRSASPCFTFKGVAAMDYRVRNPAPGHYNPERCTEATSAQASAPVVSMSSRIQPPTSHSRQPAPGEYDTYKPYLEMCKGLPVSIKFRHEKTVSRAAVAPGPGEYKLPSSLGGPSHTIATHTLPSSSRQQQQAPGPAEYEVFESTIGVAGKLHLSRYPTETVAQPTLGCYFKLAW